MHLEISCGKWRPFCLSLNVLSMLQFQWLLLQSSWILITGQSLGYNYQIWLAIDFNVYKKKTTFNDHQMMPGLMPDDIIMMSQSSHWGVTWMPGRSYDTTYVSWLDGLAQGRRNSIALAMELRLSCTNPSMLQPLNNVEVRWGGW